MKTVYLEKLPKCDYEDVTPGCLGEATYDAPTISGGRWAHMCEHHYEMFKSPIAEQVGCKLAQRELAKPKEGKPVLGLEPGIENLEYWENVLFDGLREVECPECGDIKNVEPDANYTFTCECCGVKVKCPTPPM